MCPQLVESKWLSEAAAEWLRQPPDMVAAVADLVKQIPRGRVSTFGDLAGALGDRKAARWVAVALRDELDEAVAATHRVVRADGRLGRFRGDDDASLAARIARLRSEGVPLKRDSSLNPESRTLNPAPESRTLNPAAVQSPGRARGCRDSAFSIHPSSFINHPSSFIVHRSSCCVDLDRCRFAEFSSSRPLAVLREVQAAVGRRLRLTPRQGPLRRIAGLDVSYPQGRELAVGAYALFDLEDQAATSNDEPVASLTVEVPVRFPYITSYLTFRELPVLLALIEAADRAGLAADVLMVDGSGILHPRRAGVASTFGIVVDRPTIGLTKRLLCGRVDLAGMQPGQSRPVVVEDQELGIAVLPRSGTRRPLFASPGHRVDLDGVRDVLARTLGRRRLPTPIYWADRLSRAGNDER